MGDDAGVRSRVSVAGVSVSVDHYVGGRRLSSPTTFENRSPSDWSTVLAEVSAGDAATADAALTAAAEAFEGWAALGPTGRAPHLRRLADLIDERVADIAAVECVDMGMRHESLRNRVIGRGARNFRAYAELAEQHEERLLLLDQLVEDPRHRERRDDCVRLHQHRTVGAHRERRAQLLLGVGRADADREHFICEAALLDAERLLERDLVEGVDAHLDAIGDDAAAVGLALQLHAADAQFLTHRDA